MPKRTARVILVDLPRCRVHVVEVAADFSIQGEHPGSGAYNFLPYSAETLTSVEQIVWDISALQMRLCDLVVPMSIAPNRAGFEKLLAADPEADRG